VMDIELAFLHDGLPKKHLMTVHTSTKFPEPETPCLDRLDETLKAMLRRKNICSKEFISIQYDHTVQGGHVLGPVQGTGRVQAMATLTKVIPGSKKGVGLSQGIFPTYSEIDPYRMAGACIDTAIRGLIALGIPLDAIAILDNFCWCSSDDPGRLDQLKGAALGCYDGATGFQTPFISGKDSMFNDFSGFDDKNNPVKVSVPPTLLISSIGIHPDVSRAVSMDAKIEGDLIYIIGDTTEELGGSEYFAELGSVGNNVPALDIPAMKARYARLTSAISHELVVSAFPVTHGGLGVALAKVAISGRHGMEITVPGDLRPDYLLFSETLGRFVVTVAPDNKRSFEREMGPEACLLGRVGGTTLRITGKTLLVEVPVRELEAAYKAPFGRY
jgi:phosphoribosylformylglycinamidine synthase subunit PurSL